MLMMLRLTSELEGIHVRNGRDLRQKDDQIVGLKKSLADIMLRLETAVDAKPAIPIKRSGIGYSGMYSPISIAERELHPTNSSHTLTSIYRRDF